MQPEVTFNHEKNGIEIRFPQKPSAQVRTELYNMGFRYHRGKKFWYAPVTEPRIVFVKQLQQQDVTGEEQPAAASFEPSDENIDNGNFSYVSYAVQGSDGKTGFEDYIVFEPTRAKALDLAKEFAEQRYGDTLKDISIHPRNYKSKAHELFAHERIIGNNLTESEANSSIKEDVMQEPTSPMVQQDESALHEEESSPANVEQPKQLTDPLTNEHGVEGIELQEKGIQEEERNANPDLSNEVASEYTTALTPEDVQGAQWIEADEEYPVNKAIIDGVAYHQARLRKVLIDKISKLPLENQLAIAGKLKERFKERRSFETYDQSYVTYGKKGKERQSVIISSYIDDIVIDNDLYKNSNHPVLTYLLDIISNADKEPEKSSQETFVEAQEESSQEQLNRQIENLVDKKFPEKIPLKEEEKNLISQYNGHAPGRAGLIPDEIIQFSWKIANQYGYRGGSVLDPCVGTGHLFRYAPKEAKVIGYDHHSFATTIAKILYPFATIHQQPFESIFFDENDNHLKDQHQAPEFELVISSPSVGPFTGMFSYLDEKHWTHADQYAEYCMTRGLDLLVREGLLIFLMPFDFMHGPSSKVKEAISKKSELIDAFRIESLQTDIVVLRKKQSL